MTHAEIRNHRVHNQRIVNADFTRARDIVHWMGAMQAQEYAMAKWAIGMRTLGLADSDVEKSFNKGEILRTHVLRPTWHFVVPEDIRWMLSLTADRVHQVNSSWYRKLNYDSAFFKKTNDILAKALEGNKYLTRTELQTILADKKIMADGSALTYIMMHAELDAVICSGPRKGKQFTYAMLDERVLASKILNRKEQQAELSERYFTSRGPATLQDFVTWSGLRMKDVKEGVESLPNHFQKEVIDGQEFIFSKVQIENPKKVQPTFLMPDYDEYGMGYKNRDAINFPSDKQKFNQEENAGSYHMIVVEGTLAGTWKKEVKGNAVTVQTFPFETLSKPRQAALLKAEEHFIKFSTN